MPQKSDGGGAPSLPWGTKGAAAPWCESTRCEKKGRDAAPSGSEASGDAVADSGCRGGDAAEIGRRRRAIPTMGDEGRCRAMVRELTPQPLLGLGVGVGGGVAVGLGGVGVDVGAGAGGGG